MPDVPAVKQCRDPESSVFGCVAVEGRGLMAGRWMIGNPESGGHWGDAAEVKDWDLLS